MNTAIYPVSEETLEAVLDLFGQYQTFYKASVDRDKNRSFLNYLLENPQEGVQFLALEEDQPLGFATIYYTYSSVSAERTGTLNDLYVIPAARGKGVGRALIDYCAEFLQSLDIKKMIWLTHTENETAQRLYDTYPASRDTWYEYCLSLPD